VFSRRRGTSVALVLLVVAAVLGTSDVAAVAEPTAPSAGSGASDDSSNLHPEDDSVPVAIDPGDPPGGDFSGEPDPAPIHEPTPAPTGFDGTTPAGVAALSAQFDPSTATVVERSEYENTYADANGVKKTEVSPEPTNVQIDGEWVPIDNSLQTTGLWSMLGVGGAQASLNPLHPKFTESASDPGMMTLTRDSHQVSFTLDGAARSELDRGAGPGDDARSHLEYPDVFRSTDLLYDVTNGGVKENLRLAEAPGADGRASWSWHVSADGLTLSKDRTGVITFADADGKTVFVIPPAQMSDSSGVAGRKNSAETTVGTTLMRQGDDWIIVFNADRAWLNDPSRVYPVLIDPGAQVNSAGTWAFRSDDPYTMRNENAGIQVGNSNNGYFWRTNAFFPYSNLFGTQIAQVDLGTSDLMDGREDPKWFAASWAKDFSFDAPNGQLMATPMGTTGVQVTDDRLSDTYAAWVRNRQDGSWLAFNGEETEGDYSYKYFNAALVFYWKNLPTLGDYGSTSPANGASRVSLTPTLSVDGASADPGFQVYYRFRVSTNPNPDADPNPAYDSGFVTDSSVTVPATKLQPGAHYYWNYWVEDNANGYRGTSTQEYQGSFRNFTTNVVPVTSLSTANPADKSVLVGTTPTLSVDAPLNPDGRSMKYWFRIASGADAKTGAIVSSGWITSTSWTVPANSLQDGGAYTWTVLTNDGVSDSSTPWVGHFRVNQRISDPGPAPTDASGPVIVNLANGNAGLSFTSPTVSTLGGPMGMSFTYNSERPSNAGLKGEYFDATGGADPLDFAGRSPVLVRTDPGIDFNWDLASPTDATTGAGAKPLVPADKFLVRWTGYITLKSGTYNFGAHGDDGFRAWIGSAGGSDAGTQLFSNWAASADRTTWSDAGKTVTVPAGTQQTFPFRFEYFESTSTANVTFEYRTITTDPNAKPVPPSWFTRTPEILPNGWGGSSVLAGDANQYVRAVAEQASIEFTDVFGTVHSYAKKSAGGFEPPEGEAGVASVNADGIITLADETGVIYTFRRDGAFDSATSPTDIKKPASPVIAYRAGTTLIDSVTDRLSTRSVKYLYGGDSGCTVDPGFTSAPAQMLCGISYPDGSKTKLEYGSTGNLLSIVNPGNETASFEYDGQGRLSHVWNSLANDWLRADTSRHAGPANRTDITYGADGKVSKVQLPAPYGVTETARPTKTFDYSTPGTTKATIVDPSGAVPPVTSSVSFDSSYQTTSTTSPEGLTAQTAWNSKDQQLWTTNAQGLESTNIYNAQDRLTDSYGPSPEACFDASRLPVAGCPITPAHSQTNYDEGLKGLDVAYWNNPSLSGVPKAMSLGLSGVTGGEFARDYGTNPPIADIPSENWSLRATGLIHFPTTGRYNFDVWADDAVRVWIDDVLIIDNWTYHPAAFVGDWKSWPPNPGMTVAAGSTARIKIEYAQSTSVANVQLNWQRPGWTTTWEVTPGDFLTPDSGLTTSTKTYDSPAQAPSLTTSAAYASPWLGLPTSTTVDPGGLNLTTQTLYEKLVAVQQADRSAVACGCRDDESCQRVELDLLGRHRDDHRGRVRRPGRHEAVRDAEDLHDVARSRRRRGHSRRLRVRRHGAQRRSEEDRRQRLVVCQLRQPGSTRDPDFSIAIGCSADGDEWILCRRPHVVVAGRFHDRHGVRADHNARGSPGPGRLDDRRVGHRDDLELRHPRAPRFNSHRR
jgi:YD repeat-containing protein